LTVVIEPDTVASLPKAVLHDHLDGGLRVETVLDLADEAGYDGLPSYDADELRAWFHQGRSGSLEGYLEAFEHTISVKQEESAISRVAYECGVDLAADNVVYAEVRYAPSLFTEKGLPLEAVFEAANDGFDRAMVETGIEIRTIAVALRHLTDSADVARAAVRYLGRGVVAFDLAGPEAGFPADLYLEACQIVREGGLGLTLHGGEGDGAHSIWRALALCGAQRIGHGVHIADDTDFDGSQISELGPFARRVRDQRIPLEVCVSSNIHTASYASIETHPFGALYRNGFNVSINTDNRLMSGVSVSSEYSLATEAFGLSIEDLGLITESAIEAGFGDYPSRKRLIDTVVRPAYAEAAANGR
jgi:adenosine deaminase